LTRSIREDMLTLQGENGRGLATQDVMVDLNNSKIEDAATGPVLDAACMAELRALDPDGKAQLVKRVLATYQASLAKLVDQLREAQAEQGWEQVSRVAHTLKSSSASIGALALSALCADIERLLRRGDNVAAAALLDRFHAEVARVDVAVGQTLQHLEAAAS
jgi:HPt (histidine-containing phosphotransfer) domain-containing protein